ncbi:PREDICTED: evolutionarily conserved signaling intermediate in Toll pathway, mitochondrial-like [Amphimedon queenslandica]|uniref:Evolutionarily conserved signaling intermediate in Toll pathway, mitochondrial n=1 Tax=Amphimedon queenslandica TaxID=400682 RepID=A0A1X7US75_AMPQE|nr:PREDICTED: evolutionarily conserved signaling intermediate in Toll pathway, mitochondrial-like [Amphimedon queenslandica]|eukprot:XP_011404145.1 PREDICTED: evolutionarily conserved signaling intermediate in Toll pathway, mitochondrial-like [Amphimedon queenslandica]
MASITLCIRKASQKYLLSNYYLSSRLLLARTIKTSFQDCKNLEPQESSSYGHLLDEAKKDQSLAVRERFAEALMSYMSLEKNRSGHMKFIKEGLSRMDEFGLQKDLLSYNRLLDLFPKGRFNNKSFFDTLWPKPHPQIDLALEILSKMEDNGIRPDNVTYTILCETFSRISLPVQKCERIAFWFDKFEDIDPYRIKGDMPTDLYTLSKMALQRISGEDCKVWNIKEAEGEGDTDSFVIAASSKKQVTFLKSSSFSEETVLHVDGPHLMWLQKMPLFYYSLRLLPTSTNDSENPDGIILGVCLCQPPTQESLTLWIQTLQEEYPLTKAATVVYDVTVLNEDYYSELKTLNKSSALLPHQLE